MSAPPEIKSRLAMLREEFANSDNYQGALASWWAQLSINERALLLGIAGLDGSEAAARRQWRQLLKETRDTLLTECKRVARLVDGLKWA
jgi:hypothetical protein